MGWIGILLGALAAAAGLRQWRRVRAARASTLVPPPVDDDAIRRILAEGKLPAVEAEEPLDLDEIARAEEEFWSDSWEDPEEYGR